MQLQLFHASLGWRPLRPTLFYTIWKFIRCWSFVVFFCKSPIEGILLYSELTGYWLVTKEKGGGQKKTTSRTKPPAPSVAPRAGSREHKQGKDGGAAVSNSCCPSYSSSTTTKAYADRCRFSKGAGEKCDHFMKLGDKLGLKSISTFRELVPFHMSVIFTRTPAHVCLTLPSFY